MYTYRIWKQNWIILAATCVHFTWGLILLFAQVPLFTTPLAGLRFLSAEWVGVVLLVAAILAMLPMIFSRLDTPLRALACVGLQQWLMMSAFWSVIIAVIRGQYPDGYVPPLGNPHLFIFVDQLWPIMGAIFHSVSLIDWLWYSRLSHEGNC